FASWKAWRCLSSVRTAGSEDDKRSSARSPMASRSLSTPSPVFADMADGQCLSLGERRGRPILIVEPKRQIGMLGAPQRSVDALALDGIVRVPDSRRVDQNHRISAKIEKDFDQVA